MDITKNDEEFIPEVELAKVLIDGIYKSSEFHMRFLGLKYERLNNELKYKMEEEPLSFFKKKHQQWEKEVEKLEKEIEEVLKAIGEEVNEMENFKNEFTKKETA